MRIVIYKADKKIPFTTAYNQLGSPNKIIFSNRSEQVTDFNNKSVDELRHLVEPWLPKKSVIGSHEEDTIFYVPFEIKGKFMEILENWIDGFKKMMGKGEKDSVPTSQQLGLGEGSSLASFYDDMEKQEVYIVEKRDAERELVKLFNFIADQDNEIDAVILSTFTSGRTRVAYSSEPKGERTVKTETFAMQLKDLIALLDKTQQVYPDAGTLDYVMFQNAASGGTRGSIFHITHLPQYGKYCFLTFISATAEGIEMLEYFREQNLDKIKELLDDIYS